MLVELLHRPLLDAFGFRAQVLDFCVQLSNLVVNCVLALDLVLELSDFRVDIIEVALEPPEFVFELVPPIRFGSSFIMFGIS